MVQWTHFAAAFGLAASLPVLAEAQAVPAESGVASETNAPQPAAEQLPVVVEADNFYEIPEDNSVVAEGNVEAAYEGRVLRADRLVYNRNTNRVRANGNVIIIDKTGEQQFADEIDVDAKLSDGYVIGYASRLADGATVVANSAIRQKGGANALSQVIYTACEVCEEDTTPTWSLRARRAVLDEGTKMMSYRDVVVEVAGVPVLYLPYLAHPDPNSGRRSGLLIPSLGLSSKLGAFYQQPYYWAYSESADLTIAPLISENANPLLEVDWRKRFYSGSVRFNASATNEQEFDSEGARFGEEKFRGHIYGAGRFALTPNWQWGFGVESQTDDLYDRRYDIDGQNELRGLYESQPRRLLSQLFVAGQGDSFYADASILKSQGLRGADDDSRLPFVAPLLYGEKYWNLGDFGFASVNASTAFLTRETGPDSQRASLGAEWSDMNILPGGFTFEPFAELRGDYYKLDEAISGKDSLTRTVGNAGARLAYPMVKTGEAFDLYIEPTVMAAWGFSDVNDTAIPIEDSLLFESDEASLFQPNGFGNYDLYEGDGKVSAGLTARAIWKEGLELSGTFGRRWRSESDPAFNKSTNLDGTSSDWVAAASANFGNPLRIDARVRLDDDGMKLNRIDTRFSTQFNRFRAVGQYYKINERISPVGAADEGVYLRGEARVTKQYSVIFGALRDITDEIDTQQEFGFAFEDECSRFELVYSRSGVTDRTIKPSENIQFRFSLKSIGDFGSSEFD